MGNVVCCVSCFGRADTTGLDFLGYFSRWAAFRKLMFQFLESGTSSNETAQTKKQILSLGAGFDTTYFQLLVRLFSFL